MSEDTTRGTDGEHTEDDRQHRAAELTAQAQALFSSGFAGAEETDATDAADGTDPAEEADDETGPADVAVAEADDDTEDGPDDDPEDDSEEEDVPVVAVMTEAVEDAPGTSSGDQSGDEAAPLPSFGVVFQAPDLSDIPRRRSRRATSGVTTPQERPAEPEPQEAAADEQDVTDADDPNGTDESGARSGRRRRRGGKGRRGRGTSDQGADDGTDSGEDGDDQDADDTAGDTDTGERDQSAPAAPSRRSRRSRRSTADTSTDDSGPETAADQAGDADGDTDDDGTGSSGTRRRRRRRRTGEATSSPERSARDEVTSVRGSTRLEAKRQRRREGREAGRRRTVITEAEFLARRESVERVMVVRGLEDRTQIAVLEDGVPVEHYVSRSAQSTMAGNVYLGRVQNVLPSMEAAFVDIGKGRNAVLYAGEVNWDAAGVSSGEPKRIENALKSGDSVLVQVTKDPIGHKGARLTSQISLPGRYLVYVPGNSMTGISRKLPDTERTRLKKILKEVVPEDAGVIVRTAAEGAAEADLRADVERLTATWARIQGKAKSANAPALLHGEPDMTVRVIRDVFTEDFSRLVVSGEQAWSEVKRYIDDVAPDLAERVERHTGSTDVFTTYRVHEAIAKAMDRKVWLPSGGSLVIDRTEAMTVVDVNTGKFTGSGGNLEETVTKNNIEAAEEIVRQLRLRDIGGIIVIDFIDMVLESNRELVVRRLLECLGRDRTKHQVAEVTSLGLVQMTRKRVGSGLIEVFSEPCAHCSGRGVVVQSEPVQRNGSGGSTEEPSSSSGSRRGRGKGRGGSSSSATTEPKNVLPAPNPNGPTPAQIAAAAHAAALQAGAGSDAANAAAKAAATEVASPGTTDEPTPQVPDAGAAAAEARAAEPAADRAPDSPSAQEPATPEAAAETAQDAGPEGATTEDTSAQEASAPARSRRRATAKSTPTKGGKRAATKKPPAATQAAPTATEPAPAMPEPTQAAPEPTQAPATPEPTPATGDRSAEPPAPAEAPAAAPKRRRRGRVVAPAGPPVGGPEAAAPADQA